MLQSGNKIKGYKYPIVPNYATPTQVSKMNKGNVIRGFTPVESALQARYKEAIESGPHSTMITIKHKKKKAKIVMSKKKVVKEHSHLVKVLKSGKGLKKEAKKQSEELKEYKKHKKHKCR